MHEVLDRYVRSMKERGPARDDPERHQDLGTLVCWMLGPMGFEVTVRSFYHDGVQRTVDKGRREFGVDIEAVRRKDGAVFWFVLKRGNLTRSNWDNKDTGVMATDLREAASRAREMERAVTLVAVHNGDVLEELQSQVDALCGRLVDAEGSQVRAVEWWDAASLVERLAERMEDTSTDGLGLFPPLVRPFLRLCVDSLRLDSGKEGRTWSHAAAAQVIEQRLPHDRALQREPQRRAEPLGEGPAMKGEDLARSSNELALFAHMVEIACRHDAGGNVMPVLEVLERTLCRTVEHLRRIEKPPREAFETLLRGLLAHHLACVLDLARRLEPIADVPMGLSVPDDVGERIDWPLRSLRIASTLALGGLTALDRGQEAEAARLGELVGRLFESNQGGFDPITDDQIIEWELVWDCWERCGQVDRVVASCRWLLDRLGFRFKVGFPMPASRQHSAWPMTDDDLRVLVEVYAGPTPATHALFRDNATTFVALLFRRAHRHGVATDEDWSAMQQPIQLRSGHLRKLTLQTWQPPEDVASTWYVCDVPEQGQTQTCASSLSLAEAMAQLDRFHPALPQSPAEAWGVAVVDRIAQRMYRIPVVRPPGPLQGA